MSCPHEYTQSTHVDYEMCARCGTYHRLKPPPPKLYEDDYWSEKSEHNTIKAHQHNVEVHTEYGETKNSCVIKHITCTGRDAALEIGCAPGNLLRRLKEQCCFERVIGVEIDRRYMADINELAGNHADFLFGYFPKITDCLHPNYFDLIVALDIFEHTSEPEVFLAECRRLLNVDGQLMLMLPLMHSAFNKRFFHVEHVYLHTSQNMQELLMDSGFASVKFSKWTEGHEIVSAYKT